MQRSTELKTFDMTNTIYRNLLCRTNGGINRLNRWYSVTTHLQESIDGYPVILVVETSLKTVTVHIRSCKTIITRV